MAFDALTEAEVVEWVSGALDRGDGGRILTPNVDIVRRAAEATEFLADATLVVPDGMPLLWAAHLAGTPLPERVAGSSLVWSLARLDARIFLVGGVPGTADRLGGTVVGHVIPPFGFEKTMAYDELCAEIIEAKPDLVYVGLGFPKQEHVISRLRTELPAAWFLGCGASLHFVAGELRRAPAWMQRTGLEWLHRLLSEPRRLAGRYLLHDAPFALKLLLTAACLSLLTRRD